MAIGITGAGASADRVQSIQKLSSKDSKEITAQQLKAIIDSNCFRYFALTNDSFLLLKKKTAQNITR